jgi:hypothetical protein
LLSKRLGSHIRCIYIRIEFVKRGADHYSSAAVYLRANGMLPPTAQPKK